MTSLDWYREALNEGASTRRKRTTRWFRGWPFLRFHLSVYAFVVVVLFAIDVARSSGHLWIGTVAFAWAAVIVIHAAIAGIFWALGLLSQNQDTLEAEHLQWTDVHLRPRGWGNNEPQDADFRPAVVPTPISEEPIEAETPQWDRVTAVTPAESYVAPAPASPSTPAPPPVSGGDWGPLRSTNPPLPADAEPVSWKEAAAAAWLTPVDSVDAARLLGPRPEARHGESLA